MRGLAGRPGERAVRAQSNLIDPSPLVVGGEDRVCPASIGPHKGTVVPAGEDANTVRGAGENGAAMNGHTLFALFGCEEQVFFAKNEHRCSAEKMHADDSAARRDRADAVGERGQRGGGVGHFHSLSFRDGALAPDPESRYTKNASHARLDSGFAASRRPGMIGGNLTPRSSQIGRA